jgi:hypothetical protein
MKGAMTMREFFGLNEPFKWEWQDLRAGIQLLNVILIMIFGLSISWFGLAIAVFGICKDLSKHRHINDLVIHFSGVILNIHFLNMLYGG